MRLLASLGATLLLAGCTQEESTWNEVMTEIDAWTPKTTMPVAVVGSGRVEVPVLLLNDYQAAVPGGSVQVSVTGPFASPVSTTVDVDAFGYALVQVDVPEGQPEAFEVTVTGSSDGATTGDSVTAWGLANPVPRLRMARAVAVDGYETEPTLAALGTGGVAVAAGEQIWWVPGDGEQPAFPVARLDGRVQGMWSAHVDADGVLDLVAWAGKQVVLLRGHPLGGYAFGGAWESLGDAVVGVAVADLDSDLNADLAVATSGEESAEIALLMGDGAWHFEAERTLEVNSPVYSIAAGDEDHDGRPDISLLHGNRQSVRRYTLGDNGWVGGTPPELAGYEVEAGASLLPLAVEVGEGQPEVIIVGPEGSTQDLVFYVVSEQVRYPDAFTAFHPGLADVNDDGITDLLAMEDDSLAIIRWDEATTSFKKQEVGTVGTGGPIAMADFDGDEQADLAVADAAGLRILPGAVDDNGGWSRDDFSWRSYSAALAGDAVLSDFDGDGRDELAAFATSSGQLTVSLWAVVDDTSGLTLSLGDRYALGSDATGLGLAACGGAIYALVDDGAATKLLRLVPGADLSLGLDGAAETSASMVACATDATGQVVVATAATSGVATLWNGQLSEIGSDAIGAVQAIAVRNEGSGSSVVGCAEAGCNVIAADLDGDGADEVIRGGAEVTVEQGGVETGTGRAGLVSIADVDGDGTPDVFAHDADAGELALMRGLVNGLGPALVLATEQDAVGPALVGDLTGDGVPELSLVGTAGEVMLGGETGAAGTR